MMIIMMVVVGARNYNCGNYGFRHSKVYTRIALLLPEVELVLTVWTVQVIFYDRVDRPGPFC